MALIHGHSLILDMLTTKRDMFDLQQLLQIYSLDGQDNGLHKLLELMIENQSQKAIILILNDFCNLIGLKEIIHILRCIDEC